jgi:alkanesulfonate monooxygenase SsuD/methylene tetrahydromethanopterin reductase-like flavin-dependent oxidoreductase (luciferase family)
MRLVVTMGIRQLPTRPRPLQDLYRDHLDEAVLAEELGFDNVWASEHHFAEDAWNPSPITFLAAVAARTERIRIGTYVLLLPFHNPVRVAEDIAVLDNLSGGRVDLPVGVGSAVEEEFPTFGIPFNERLGRTFEALRIIERCFAGEEFSHAGKYYEFPNVRMTTSPVQRPGPPIWVASMGDQSVAWTARRGYHLAAGAGRGHAKYEELLVQYGHDRSRCQVASIPVRVHLAETREQAWDEAEAGLHQVLNFYRTRVDLQSATSAAAALEALPPVGEFRNVQGIGHRGTPFVVGTPDEVGRALEAYRDKRLTHLSLNFHQPGMDTKAVRCSMTMFARELMPSVKTW